MCPFEFKIYYKVGENWVNPIPAAQDKVLTFYADNGSMDFSTTDYTLDGEVWEIRLTKESIYSESA